MSIVKSLLAADPIPTFTWTVPPELQDACMKIGFVLAVIWFIFIAFQFALPGRQGGGRKLSRIGAMGFIGAALLILLLFNISSLPDIVNWVIGVINWIADLIGSIS